MDPLSDSSESSDADADPPPQPDIPNNPPPVHSVEAEVVPVQVVQAAVLEGAVAERGPPAKRRRKQRSKKPLPPELATITIANRDLIIVADQQSKPESEDMPVEIYKVAVAVKSPIDGQPDYDLSLLNHDQLKDFAKNLTVPGSSRMNKMTLLRSIAEVVIRSAVVEGWLDSIANDKPLGHNEPQQLRFNTIVRLVNVLFSEDYLPRYLARNNRKTREDREVGDGPKMEHFWSDVEKAMFMSDESEMDLFGVVDRFLDDDDDRIRLHIDESEIDPRLYVVQQNLQLKQWTECLVKVRMTVNKNQTTSGEHGNDIWDSIKPALLHHKVLKQIGVFPAYYFCLKARNCPDFDSKFVPFLCKVDTISAVTTFDTSDMSDGNTPGSNKASQRSKNGVESMLTSVVGFLEKNQSVFAMAQEKANQVQERLAIAQEKANQGQERLAIAQEKANQVQERLASIQERVADSQERARLANIRYTLMQELSLLLQTAKTVENGSDLHVDLMSRIDHLRKLLFN